MVQFHPETLFKTSDTWNTANKPEFNDLCIYVIKSEADSAQRVKQNLAKKAQFRYDCHLCERSKFENFTSFAHHLASRHYKVLREKLKILDEDKGLEISTLMAQLKSSKKRERCVGAPYKALAKLLNQFIEQLGDGSRINCSLCSGTFSFESR